ncbi:MAG TPA: N-acetylmuramoyl-L-alanine amidase [Chthoniobacterales bacterium]|nr:N-acetylmuramoyl-L-alanine amidase [Chthoniobacterales bacterium]
MLSHASRGLLFFALLALVSCSTTETTVSRKNTLRTFNTVVVDAGHGGKDSGASRRFGPPEKVVTLDVAQRLNRKLRESQFKTVMTRSSDVFIPLDQRVAIGNRQSNSVFVSIHFNDSRRRGIRGIETYYSSPYAASLAQRIQRKLLTIRGMANRGVRPARFRVLRNAVYPSVLVECGFLSNRGDGGRAGSAGHRDLLADKISEAIVEERYGAGVYNAPTRMAGGAVPDPQGARTLTAPSR